jgi:hypothetical protein
MRTWVLGIGALFGVAGFAASCGSSGGTGTDGGGSGTAGSPADSSAGDGKSKDGSDEVIIPQQGGSSGSSGSGGSGGVGGSDGSGSGGSGGAGGSGGSIGPDSGIGPDCFKLYGTGDEQTCAFSTTNEPGFHCSEELDFMNGPCPATDLYGCCVTTTKVGMYTKTGAACYYSAKTGLTGKSTCTMPGEVWQTTSP